MEWKRFIWSVKVFCECVCIGANTVDQIWGVQQRITGKDGRQVRKESPHLGEHRGHKSCGGHLSKLEELNQHHWLLTVTVHRLVITALITCRKDANQRNDLLQGENTETHRDRNREEPEKHADILEPEDKQKSRRTWVLTEHHDIAVFAQSLLSWQSHLLRLLRLTLRDADAVLSSARLQDQHHSTVNTSDWLSDSSHSAPLPNKPQFTTLIGCHE